MRAGQRGTPRTRRLAVVIERRAGLIMGMTLLFAVVCGWSASHLRIDQRLRKLLPDHFASVAGMDRVAERLGNQNDIYIAIQSPSVEANIAFGDALFDDLQGHPDLSWSLFRRNYDFFERHALLYAEIDDLLDLRRRVIERIFEQTRTSVYGEFSVGGDDESPPTGDHSSVGLDEDELRRRYGLDEGREQFFVADDGRLLVLKARPQRDSSDLEFARRLQANLQRRIDRLIPARFHPSMAVSLHGSFVQHGQRVSSLRREVVGGTAAAIVALLASIAMFFRSIRAIGLVLGPLLVAAVGALGFAWLVYEALNLVSAFIFAILLGLGIDFAIHILARYRDERARHHRRPTALAITLATTGRSTVVGGVGTGLTFSALTIADFQGFAQFGVIAGVGLLLALLSALVVMPAAVVLSERQWPWPPPPPRQGRAVGALGRWWVKAAGLITIGGIGLASYAAIHARDLEFEYDFRALGPKSEQRAEKAAERQITYRDAIGRVLSVAPAIALTDSRTQARDLYRQLSVLALMRPEEAESLQPIDARRELRLADLVDSSRLSDAIGPERRGLVGVREPPTTGPIDQTGLHGDEGDPSTRPASDTFDDDDWDADLDDDAGSGSPEAKPRSPELDDPRFLAIARAERARRLPTSAVDEQLRAYSPERRSVMSDRLRAVSSIDAFVPRQQATKLEIIADIRAHIDAKRDLMAPDTRAEIDSWYDQLRLDRPVDVDDLPSWIKQQFMDAHGEIGRFIVIRTGGAKADYLNSRRIYDAFATLTTPEGEVDVAAEFFVFPEVFEAIEADGPRVLLLASCAMLLTVGVAFRGVIGVAVVSLVVSSTLLWLVGFMLAMGWKLNFFNVIVLPLLIGMAQDDALHVFERWRAAGPGQLAMVLAETGGAVVLTTITTICGFSGILVANHRGLQSMASTAVVGMVLALIASLVMLPFVLWVADRGRSVRERSRNDGGGA